jgi:hypothetical protein
MKTPVKLILGAVATGCIAVGVAAQTGTVQSPHVSVGGGGAVSGRQQAVAPSTSKPASPSPDASPSPQPTPDATTVAAPVSSGDEEGDGEGDGQGHGHGNGHKG